MTGWWIWAGDGGAMPDDFHPHHARHVAEICPAADPFLALPAGWRFVIPDNLQAAEFDSSLLESGH
jgi:hypothetical protein